MLLLYFAGTLLHLTTGFSCIILVEKSRTQLLLNDRYKKGKIILAPKSFVYIYFFHGHLPGNRRNYDFGILRNLLLDRLIHDLLTLYYWPNVFLLDNYIT